MEKYFGNAYRGDPGVPHADADRFVNIWIGSAAFSVLTWVNPYMWQLSNQFKYFSLSLSLELSNSNLGTFGFSCLISELGFLFMCFCSSLNCSGENYVLILLV
ncbi:unknown protein [Arabidopsis thaliana]|uniref:F8A24.9 protein n=1 Tax=Arabidopsis thaliana TaxID=3702 RepID=Q9SF88_ARATH|nr:unknown protein [Arabidopsis thaliana]